MKTTDLNRRKFIRYTAAISTGLSLSPFFQDRASAEIKTRSIQYSNEYIFFLVNTTSAPVRPLRSLIPVHDIATKLNLEAKLDKYKILRSSGTAKVTYRNGRVEIHVEKLDDFFAVHLSMVS